MRVLLLIFSSILIGRSYGGMILHDVREHMHSKMYGHGLHGETPTSQNSPIINVNNYQGVSQQASSHNQDYTQNQQMYGFQPSNGGHIRGDHGTLSNYGQHLYGSGGFMNSNVKAGGMKYGNFGGYGSHDSMKQESHHHREGPKFGQHHDTNTFGNTNMGSSAATSSSSSASSSAGASSAASSSSSVIGGGDSYFNTRVKPWLY